jgi:glutamyl-tRNA reductase
VSYAVVQLLRQAALHDPSRRICLMGLGKIGALTLKNLRHYLPDNKITLINRNQAKAEALAETYHVSSAPISAQAAVLRETDILIVATGADHAIISSSDVAGTPVKMIFDLSVPSNVSEDVKQLPGITFYDIDHLSDIVNETLIKRQKEIPLAESIIEENLTEYSQWKIRRDSYHRSAETENGNDE